MATPQPHPLTLMREEMEAVGNHRAASVIGTCHRMLAEMQALLDASQGGQEAARLRAVITHAMEHQTNQEVQRWLELALLPGSPVIDNQGRRVDQLP